MAVDRFVLINEKDARFHGPYPSLDAALAAVEDRVSVGGLWTVWQTTADTETRFIAHGLRKHGAGGEERSGNRADERLDG